MSDFIIAVCKKTIVAFGFVVLFKRAIFSYRVVTIERLLAAEKV